MTKWTQEKEAELVAAVAVEAAIRALESLSTGRARPMLARHRIEANARATGLQLERSQARRDSDHNSRWE